MSLASEAMAILEKDEADVLLNLFSGLESVLQLRSRRGQKAFHSAVRTDVEALTNRDLDDYRLERVLGLAGPNVIDVEWVSVGQDINLELFQRDKDGNKRFPTLEEMSQRKEDFKAALAVARESGQLPQASLPKRPAPAPTVNIRQMPALPVPQLKPIAATPKFDNSSTRQEALLERVRARHRKAIEMREREKEYEGIHRGIGVCDDAEIAHKVLQSLFARGEGKNSVATEEEILQALSSASFNMQCKKTLDARAAQEALTLLIEKSTQWFTIQAGVHNPKAKFFRRLPQGRAADALAGIQAERLNRETQLRELCEKAKRQEQGEATSEVIVGKEAIATNTQVKNLKLREVREKAKRQEQGEATSEVIAGKEAIATNTQVKNQQLREVRETAKMQQQGEATSEVIVGKALLAIATNTQVKNLKLREVRQTAKRQAQGEATSEVIVGKETIDTNTQLKRSKLREVRETAKRQEQGEALSEVTNTRLKRPLDFESVNTVGQKIATHTNQRDVRSNQRDVKGVVGQKSGESLLKRPRLRGKTTLNMP